MGRKKNGLIWSLHEKFKEKEDSYGTRAEREKILEMSMRQVYEKFRINNVNQLKSKHINYLVDKWKSEGKSEGTLKNRMSNLRWLARKINKDNIVERDNKNYDIANRKYVDNSKNIAKSLDKDNLEKLTDMNTYFTLKNQEQFGMRCEEAIKFNALASDKSDYIELKGSHCKGGRPRKIMIRTQEQRELLNQQKAFLRAKHQTALIPQNSNYYNQLQVYKYQTQMIGETHNHGLRHAFAQRLYESITNFKCPKNGGKSYKEYDKSERAIDYRARSILTKELGHNRIDVTSHYIGK